MSLAAISSDMATPVETLDSDLPTALARLPDIDVTTQSPDCDHLRVVSLTVPRHPPRVFSFTFPEAPAPTLPGSPPLRASISSSPPRPITPSRTPTRIKPPGDIITLEDRLYYVLQPPLETL